MKGSPRCSSLISRGDPATVQRRSMSGLAPPPQLEIRRRRGARTGRGPRAGRRDRLAVARRTATGLRDRQGIGRHRRPAVVRCLLHGARPGGAHPLASVRRRSRRRGRRGLHLRRPQPSLGQRRALRAELPADAIGHRDAHCRLRGRGGRHARAHPGHAQDLARPSPGAEICGPCRRRQQSPARPVRRGDVEGKPHPRGRLDCRRRGTGQGALSPAAADHRSGKPR